MNKWESEDEIRAHLRELTGEVRKLRREIDATLRAHEPKTERRHLHGRRWPKSAEAAVNDRKRKKAR